VPGGNGLETAGEKVWTYGPAIAAAADSALRNIVFDDKEREWIESGRSVYDLLVMLSGKDRTQYKGRKFRWAAQPSIDPLPD
jgi:hypothetical protein